MKIKKNVYMMIALATLALTAVSPVFAENNNSTSEPNSNIKGGMVRGNKGMMKPAVVGTVTAISGNIITISSKQGFARKDVTTTPTTAVATTTFTVDATNAKIDKGNVVGTIGSIVVGDTIMAQGTVTGTNVIATNIRDGIARGILNNQGNKTGQGLSSIVGNGQPVVAGTVSSINGVTLSITNKSNVSYTIDATNAKIIQGENTTATISNIAVGDIVLVQGTVNGNAVVASSVVDQKPVTSTTTVENTKSHGFFARIGSFFSHLFGY